MKIDEAMVDRLIAGLDDRVRRTVAPLVQRIAELEARVARTEQRTTECEAKTIRNSEHVARLETARQRERA